MIRVQTSSRLHFGFLSLPAQAHWPDRHGQPILPARRFGSVGLMIQSPGIEVCVEPASDWSAAGPLADRALSFARELADSCSAGSAEPQRIVVEARTPAHCGLGSGTQLALAVGAALFEAWGLRWDAVALARRLGRGQRSAIGAHGFTHGGFLVDGGRGPGEDVAPLLARCDFPGEWRIVLVVPSWARGMHGERERQALQRLQERGMSLSETDTLCRLVLLGMLPALAERDLDHFGRALTEFNARVGQVFAEVQGGIYAHPRVTELVEAIQRDLAVGVGQSSWGPAVFAIAPDDAAALHVARCIRGKFELGEGEVSITPASNHGASLARS